MKRVLLFSLYDFRRLSDLLKQHGFEVVTEDPDFVLVYGGDGSALLAERLYPSIPKLLAKKSNICRQCDFTFQGLKVILPRIKAGNYKIKKETKLEATFRGKKFVALNEIQLHTRMPVRAVRFSVTVDGRKYENLIGDGVIVATPFGSSAYYSSTGGKRFKKGIGITFNNLYNKKIKSLVVSDKSKVRIKLNREKAFLAIDNDEKMTLMKPNDIVVVRKSRKTANFITL